ncbi:MAG: hypothetical protein ACOYBP_03010 [Microbacteriaceae bacterium]
MMRLRFTTIAAIGISLVLTTGITGCSTADSAVHPAASAAIDQGWQLFSVRGATATVTSQESSNFTLTLSGLDDDISEFSSKPVKESYAITPDIFVSKWSGYFANATASAVVKFRTATNPDPQTILIEVSKPVADSKANTLSFSAKRIDTPREKSMPEELTDVDIFITNE